MKKKFYTVWKGIQPGIYHSWEECKKQVEGFTGAQYKSFESLQEAEQAFQKQASSYISKKAPPSTPLHQKNKNIIWESLSVDAACNMQTGDMEYRGVNTATGQQIFHQGVFREATNNMGEFLAIVHALAFLQKKQAYRVPVYSDSKTAIAWVKARKARTKQALTSRNQEVFDLIARAEKWLLDNPFQNPILKWQTADWGEIPADFGRK